MPGGMRVKRSAESLALERPTAMVGRDDVNGAVGERLPKSPRDGSALRSGG